MISVCIPVFNFDMTALEEALSRQLKELSVPGELIFIDDSSFDIYREVNGPVLKNHRYLELEKNVGRSRIRNKFPELASHEYLLFLDCDSEIVSERFLQDYVDAVQERKPRVICGGRVYPESRPCRRQRLRWNYGRKRESLPAEVRAQYPARSFMSNNFLVHREVFSTVRFDERIVQYGHEDTLFGFMLAQKGIPVVHLENPVRNGDVESNREFLMKSEKAVRNLPLILDLVDDPDAFTEQVSLLAAYRKLKDRGLTGLVRFSFSLSSPLVKALLLSGMAGMGLFSYYKLGILLRSFRDRYKGSDQ